METLRDPESRQQFELFCIRRAERECEERGLNPDDINYHFKQTRLNRDPEGPGRMIQPFLLEFGYDFPELAPL